jgi:hypothetical protein
MTQDDLSTAKTDDLLAEISRRFDDSLFVACLNLEGKRQYVRQMNTDEHMVHALLDYLTSNEGIESSGECG